MEITTLIPTIQRGVISTPNEVTLTFNTNDLWKHLIFMIPIRSIASGINELFVQLPVEYFFNALSSQYPSNFLLSQGYIKIYDQNGFDVSDSFESSVIYINSEEAGCNDAYSWKALYVKVVSKYKTLAQSDKYRIVF